MTIASDVHLLSPQLCHFARPTHSPHSTSGELPGCVLNRFKEFAFPNSATFLKHISTLHNRSNNRFIQFSECIPAYFTPNLFNIPRRQHSFSVVCFIGLEKLINTSLVTEGAIFSPSEERSVKSIHKLCV